MAFGYQRIYEFEVWDVHGNRIADISPLCKSRHYTMQRNGEEQLDFELDLDAFEAYCANNLNVDPTTIIAPYQTDIKVKRNGTYLFGTQIVDTPVEINDAGKTIKVSATGYLNLFKDRYVTKAYASGAMDATAIACDLITTTQAQTNGSMGVTIGGTQYTSGNKPQQTYQLDNVKDKITELANLVQGRFDFAFSWDKQFSTYQQIGALRSDIAFVFGPDGNVQSMTHNRSATSLYNKVYGIGSGFGGDALTSTKSDVVSQLAYGVRERISQFNTVVNQSTLDADALADVNLYRNLIEIPEITVTSKVFSSLTLPFLSVGDRINFAVVGHPFLAGVNDLFRIEQMDVTLDDNDFETIVLSLDTWSVQ